MQTPSSQHEPQRVTWTQAPSAIADLIGRHPPSAARIIGITGPVGAGKSALASLLSPAVISTDDYLPDYALVPEHQRDDPEQLDWPLLESHLTALQSGLTSDIPIWSFQSHRREGSRPLAPAPLIVLEGIHALHERIAAALHIRIYIEAPADIRWARWEHLETTGQRGWGVPAARAFFHNVAEPVFHSRAAAYRASAHLIVNNADYRPPVPPPRPG